MVNQEWLNGLIASIDGKDTARFISHLTDDVVFQFGNAPAVRGKGEVGKAVGGFFQAVKSLKHTVLETWLKDDALICRGTVRYTRHDSTELTVPFANILKLRNGLACEYLIYVDTSALFR